MNKQQMSEILFELREALVKNEQIDAEQSQSMQTLAGEIESRINDPQALLSGDEFLLGRLKESAENFEVKHPELTEIIGRLSDVFARMGL